MDLSKTQRVYGNQLRGCGRFVCVCVYLCRFCVWFLVVVRRKEVLSYNGHMCAKQRQQSIKQHVSLLTEFNYCALIWIWCRSNTSFWYPFASKWILVETCWVYFFSLFNYFSFHSDDFKWVCNIFKSNCCISDNRRRKYLIRLKKQKQKRKNNIMSAVWLCVHMCLCFDVDFVVVVGKKPETTHRVIWLCSQNAHTMQNQLKWTCKRVNVKIKTRNWQKNKTSIRMLRVSQAETELI